MARQGEIREGEIPPFEDDAPRQDAPHIPEGSQQDRPAEEQGSQLLLPKQPAVSFNLSILGRSTAYILHT